jgi:hypothetical protein
MRATIRQAPSPSSFVRDPLAAALLLSLLSGCSVLEHFDAANSPSNPVDDVIGVSVPLGWAANLALAVHAGQPLGCTSIADHCEGFGCLEEVTIEIDALCPLPLLDGGEGSISVWGTWLDDDQALLHFDFSEASAAGRPLIRDHLFATLATQSDDAVTVLWAWQGVTLDADGVGADQNLWAVEVARAGDGADPLADTVTVDGLSQVAGIFLDDGDDVGIVQVSVGAAVFSPECGLNPTSGEAAWQEVGTGALALQLLQFHSDCDGLADTGGILWGGLELELVR